MERAGEQPTSSSIEVDGLGLHYVAYPAPSPNAIPLLLLHGLRSAWGSWRPVAERLATQYRVIALDQRGHGDSGWAPPDRYRTDDFIADLQALVDALALQRFILVGQSMGGHNTIAYTARHPERIICALANDIPPAMTRSNDPADHEADFPGTRHRTFATIEAWLAPRREASPLTPEWAHQLAAETQLRAVEGGYVPRHDPEAAIRWQPADLWEEAKTITRPILFIRGGRSTVLAAQTLQEMDMAIPGARSITLEQAGHSTYHDRFDEWLAVAEAFFAAHGGDPR